MANKNSVNVQLNIETAFRNVKQAVDGLKKELSNINISSSLGNDLIDNFQKQAAQIKQTLSQVGNFDFSTGDSKEYVKLVQQLNNEYASLNSMVKQYSDTFVSKTQKNIAKQKEAIAAQEQQKKAYENELSVLQQGESVYQSLQSGSVDLTDKEKELAATYEQNIPRITELNSKIQSLSKSISGHKGEITKNENALKQYNRVLEVETQQSKIIKNGIEQVTNSRKKEVAQIKETEAASKTAIAQQQKATQEEEKQAKAKKQLSLMSEDFVSQMTKETNETDKLTQSIESQIIKWTSFTAVVGTAKRAITDIIQTYQELDDNLSAISAVSGISSQELWGDMPSMIDNANSLALSIDDLTNGMLLFYQQGLNAEETEIRLNAAGKMAAISQQDLATAVDQLTSAMNAFNMTGDQAQNVVDVYAALAGATAVDVQELAAAMSRTASIAQNAGLTFEQTAAFLTTMEETTRLSAETIGNSFKSIIARFTQLRTSSEALEDGVDANKVETALKTAGVALRDANGEFRDLGDVLMELSSVWDTLDTNTQRYIATTAAGTQQQSNFIALISQYQSNLDNIATATNSAGAAEQQFEAISSNLSSALTRLDNGFTAIKTSWTEGINVITLVVDALAALLNIVSKIPSGIQLAATVFGVLVAKQVAAQIASEKLTAQMIKETAARKILSTVEKSSLDSTKQLSVVRDLLTAKSKGLSVTQLYLSGVLKGLTKAEQAQVLAAYKSATANGTLKISFDLIKTSALAAASSIKAFILANPEIAAIAVVVGVVVTAFTALQNQAKKTQEQIEDLTNSIQDLNTSALETQGIADSLDGYIKSLKEAHDAGEDLTSIREEIEKSGYLEKTGIDVLTASYKDLLSTLQDVSAEQAKQASIDRGKALLQQSELDQLNGKESLKNTHLSSNGKSKDYSWDQESPAPEVSLQEGETWEDAVVRLGYTVKYYATINGKEQIFDTQQEAEDAVSQAIDNLKNPKQTYSTSSANDIVNAIESVDQDFFTALNLSSEQASSLIKIWGAKIGGSIYDSEKEEIEPAFQTFIQNIGTVLTSNAEQLNVSTEDLYNYLAGNFENLNNSTIMAIRASLNQAIEQTEGAQKEQLQEFSDNAAENYKEAFNKLKDSLQGDYELISDEDAQKIGWEGLQKIQDALEEGGEDFAKSVAEILSGDISDALENTDFAGSADQIVNELQDILEDADTSSLEGLTNVIDRLSQTEYANLPIVQELINYYNQLKGELIDSSSVMEGAYTAAENYSAALTSVANAASGTSIPLSEVQSIMTAAGMTAAEASQYFTWMGDGFQITSEKAQQLVNALANTTNATYADAIASQQSAQAKAQAAAQELRALEQKLRGYALSVTANGQLINADGQLVDAEVVLAQAIDQVAAKSGMQGTGVEKLSVATADTANEINALADQVGSMASEQEAASAAAAANISLLQAMQTQAQSAAADWRNYGDAAKSGGGGGGSSAAEGTNEATEALEAQKEAIQDVIDKWEDYKSQLEDSKQALEDQKSALEDLNDKLKDNLKLYIDLIKTRLEDEIDKQTTAVESFYDAIKDAVQKEIDAFEKNLDSLSKKADELQDKADRLQEEAEKQEDSLNKLYDAATSYYEAVQSGIEHEISLQDDAIEKNEYKISLLEDQKNAIQDQIDNLDTAADSESKLLALEKARDALANARNQKTRMVLTNGGGWRLKTDTSAVQEAQSNLASAERDYQKELLERQQDKLDEQISQLEDENEKIENIQDELEEQNNLIDNIKQDWEDAADNLGKTTSELEEQTRLLQMIASANEAERNNILNGFQSNVSQNNQQFQNAANAANEANEASNAYDYQNNADNQDSIAAAIESLKQQQNLADEALQTYFENLLSNNAEEVAIQQQMQELVNQIIQNGDGSLEAFLAFQEQVNGALESANEFASNQAAYINKINDTIAFYEEWSNRLDMTSSEINERQQIMNEINNATLSSLLEGGSTFSQLQSQYDEIVRNNDEAEKIQGQIDNLDKQIDDVQSKIDELKEQQEAISEEEKQVSNANAEKTSSAAKAAGNTASSGAKSAGGQVSNTVSNGASNITSSVDEMSSFQNPLIQQVASAMDPIKQLLGAIKDKEFKVTVNNTASSYLGGVGGRSKGGTIGFSNGGVDDFTKTVAVHGTKNRPELVLNNSQSAALFKYIDSMTRIPTLSSAGSARNALQAFNTTNNNTNNEGTSFTGCEFNIESNANNLDSLVRELKQSSSIKRK